MDNLTLSVRLMPWGWEMAATAGIGATPRNQWIPLPYTPAMMFETVVVCLGKRFPRAAIVRVGG